MNDKILITGGAGFIGYHLARKILDGKVEKLFIVDNLRRGKMDEDLKNLLADPRTVFVEGDLTRPEFYSDLPKDFTHVYHLAAVNGTRYFYEVPHEVLRINTLAIIHILDWIKTFPVKPKFMFTSSNEAYAGALEAFNQLPIPTPENVPLIVNDIFNPRWSYGGSKLLGEIFAVHYAQEHKIPTIIVRPHNFYGPRSGTEHVIPALILKSLNGADPFDLYSPKQTRSFCYITDAVTAMQMLMNKPELFDDKIVDIFHIGSEVETSIEDLAEQIFAVTGKRPENIVIKSALQGSVDRRLPDVSKIEKAIGWKERTPLSEGLRKTMEWYKKKI